MKIFKILGQIVVTTLLLWFISPFWFAGFLWGTARVNFEIASRISRQTWLSLFEKK